MCHSKNIKIDNIHIWQECHNCKMKPIKGVRYECQDCPTGNGTNLCEGCFLKFKNAKIEHPTEENKNLLLGCNIESISNHQFIEKEDTFYSANELESWKNLSINIETPPQISNGFVLRPIFTSGTDFVMGSCGFVVEIKNKLVFLTALHVMDGIIKKNNITFTNNEYTGKELPKLINNVDLFDIYTSNWMLSQISDCYKMLVLPNAKIYEKEPKSDNDIAAFLVNQNKELSPGKLAENRPTIGQTVWQAYPIEPFENLKLHAATVIEVTDTSLVFKYHHKGNIFNGGSGSPILNIKGEVVALTVGGGYYDEIELGHGNHILNINKHLNAVL